MVNLKNFSPLPSLYLCFFSFLFFAILLCLCPLRFLGIGVSCDRSLCCVWLFVTFFLFWFYTFITLSIKEKIVWAYEYYKTLSELASNKGITLLLYVSTVFELESKVFSIESLNFVLESLSLCVVWAMWAIYYIYELVFVSYDLI